MTTRPLTDAERAELRELLAKATEGPWYALAAGTWDSVEARHLSGACERLVAQNVWPGVDARLIAALRNHADALLAAADELARLKAGVADRDHTTHYDDCGCRSARYEAEIARLKAKLAAVEPVARVAVKWRRMPDLTSDLWLIRVVESLPADLLAELWKEG